MDWDKINASTEAMIDWISNVEPAYRTAMDISAIVCKECATQERAVKQATGRFRRELAGEADAALQYVRGTRATAIKWGLVTRFFVEEEWNLRQAETEGEVVHA